MRVHTVATPVLDVIAGGAGEATVLGVGSVAYLDLDGFVLCVTGPGGPLLPNGIAIARPPRTIAWPQPGARLRLDDAFPRDTLRVDSARPWTPLLTAAGASRARLLARGLAILERLESDGANSPPHDDGRSGLELLRRAVEGRDAKLASAAAVLLCGRGGGLTPEGDDLLAGAAAVVSAFGRATGFSEREREDWLSALLLPDRRGRTTALAATLLELATRALVAEPLLGVLDISDASETRWGGALRRLLRLGHTTGRANARGAALACVATSIGAVAHVRPFTVAAP
jgi:hypothetical protein